MQLFMVVPGKYGLKSCQSHNGNGHMLESRTGNRIYLEWPYIYI